MRESLSCESLSLGSLVVLRGTEAVFRRCSVKKVFLEISQNAQENTCARVSFLIKLQAGACNFIKKEILAQVFSCEFCEISKNTFFYRTPLAAAFGGKAYSNKLSSISSMNSLLLLIFLSRSNKTVIFLQNRWNFKAKWTYLRWFSYRGLEKEQIWNR